MIWRRYRNELVIGLSLLLMLIALNYRHNTVKRLDRVNGEVKASLAQIGEIIALKKQWGDEKLTEKITRIKRGIDAKKIKQFSIRSKKLTAVFKGLSDVEVNALIVKLENIAVQITKLAVKRKGETYDMEIKCKW